MNLLHTLYTVCTQCSIQHTYVGYVAACTYVFNVISIKGKWKIIQIGVRIQVCMREYFMRLCGEIENIPNANK